MLVTHARAQTHIYKYIDFLSDMFNDALSCDERVAGFWFQKFGKIDVVVSNAAANPTVSLLLETPESVLDKVWEINVKAGVLLLQVSVLGQDKYWELKQHICCSYRFD